MNLFGDIIVKMTPSERRKLIYEFLHYDEWGYDLGYFDRIYLNALFLYEITPMLHKEGQKCLVTSGEKNKKNDEFGKCYSNSFKKLKSGYGYVEGYVTDMESGAILYHSWNVDKNGNHIDFTFSDPENFEYFGKVIPNEVVFDVLMENPAGFPIYYFSQNFN